MAALAAAEGKLTKALSSVADHARGHMWLGLVNIMTRRAAQGIAKCEHALALDRNLATAHSAVGFGKIFVGRTEEAEAHIGEALRLSPRVTTAYVWMNMAGLAIALVLLGRFDEAHAAVKAGLALNPIYTVFRVGAAWTAMSDDPTYLVQIERTLEALRRAGVPEQ
jgi:tetratricopeptide (TPR) repeat protein